MSEIPSIDAAAPVEEPERALMPLTVSIDEAAALLGVSVATVRRLVQRRLLKVLPGLRHKRVVRKTLDEFASGEFDD